LGSVVWDGSFVMSHFLQRRGCAVNVTNLRVLEVGAGTGLVSMTAMRLGAATVVATDGDDLVLSLLQENLERAAGATTSVPIVRGSPEAADPHSGAAGGDDRDDGGASDRHDEHGGRVQVRRLVWGHGHPDLTRLQRDFASAGFDVVR